jgi:hypothetical protein
MDEGADRKQHHGGVIKGHGAFNAAAPACPQEAFSQAMVALRPVPR